MSDWARNCNSEDSMDIRYTVSLDDIVAFNRFHCSNSRTAKRVRLRCDILVAAVWLGAGGLSSALHHSFVPLIIGGAFALCWCVTSKRRSASQCAKLARKFFEEGKNKGSLGAQLLRLSEDGVEESNDYGSKFTRFNAIERVESTDQHTFIFTGAASAYIIPHGKVVEGDVTVFRAALEDMRVAAQRAPVDADKSSC